MNSLLEYIETEIIKAENEIRWSRFWNQNENFMIEQLAELGYWYEWQEYLEV